MLQKQWEIRRVFSRSVAIVLVGTAMLAFGTRVYGEPLLLRAAAPSSHQTTDTWKPRVEARKVGTAGELVVNNVVVVRFRESRGGLFPYERAQTAAENLRDAIDAGLRSGSVRVNTSDPTAPFVQIGSETIATASMGAVPKVKSKRKQKRLLASAKANAYEEASRWARALKRALAVPGLTVRDNGQVIPLNEFRRFRFGGAARGPITVSVATGESSIVRWQTNPATDTVTLFGLKPGRETLTVEREGATETLYVAVKPYAGVITPPQTVTVTGERVPANMIARSVRAAAWNAVFPLPGAIKRITSDSLNVDSLQPGKSQTVRVPVRVSGPDMLPVERDVAVTVANRRLPTVPTTLLLYSNNPERLTKPETLFVGRLPEVGESARLLYHHQNKAAREFHFHAELINDTDQPSQVQIMGGDAGPERDTVWVGYRAGSDFLKAHEADLSVVVAVPPRSYVSLSSLRLPDGETISGLMQLRVLSGQPPLVRVAADAMGNGRVTYLPQPLDTLRLGDAAPDRLSTHVYPNPTKRVEAEYKVGGPWTFVKYGRIPLTAAQSPDKMLHGNYGVFYDVVVKLYNPTDTRAKARIVFEPSGGMAGGIFVFGNRKVEIPQSDMPKETTLATYELAPGETRTVTVRTIPLSGSNYPASLIVRP